MADRYCHNKNQQRQLLKGKKIRKTIHENEWWFSVVDVCAALVDSVDPGAYWRKLKQRLKEEGSEVVTFCHGLKLEASDGKRYLTDCANTEGIFRIIQSIPSPKAEPFKRWLEKVGYERVKEIEDPELASKRTRLLYKLKGYPKDWIEIGLTRLARFGASRSVLAHCTISTARFTPRAHHQISSKCASPIKECGESRFVKN